MNVHLCLHVCVYIIFRLCVYIILVRMFHLCLRTLLELVKLIDNVHPCHPNHPSIPNGFEVRFSYPPANLVAIVIIVFYNVLYLITFSALITYYIKSIILLFPIL